MKDRTQKEKLLKYFVSKEWYPQLEVDVIYGERATPKPKFITDIDVLAMYPSANGVLVPIIGDCKTLKNQSPINRVFWIKGLMSYFNADKGIIILSKKIEGEHKLLANDLNVTLLSEDDFNVYSTATSESLKSADSELSKMINWEKYFELNKFNLHLSEALQYCKYEYWNEYEYSLQLRHIISKLLKIKTELNPENNSNVFLYLELASMFSLSINKLILKVFNMYICPDDKNKFEEDLKIIIWNGYENYQYWNEIRNRLVRIGQPEPNSLSLPEWSKFVQLIRMCLDNPLSTGQTPLIIKELAFQFLNDNTENSTKDYLTLLCKKYPNSAKQAIFIIDYLVKAAKLPRELSEIASNIIMKVQRI